VSPISTTLWFYYDKDAGKFSITTSKLAKIPQSRNKPTAVYFSIDNENLSYKGVKGKGIATKIEDPNRTIAQGDGISMKYLGTLDHLIAKVMR
jgi:hypothetical protein